ncbi:hypothetical protein [Siminovitchia terrae]|uniref:hypothetical protein n=1 Tax=Siminovitchia terrae TaxID=1914933 RepID=UPI00163D02CF|nr:hypothetical protein [Siminovitchia terrae]
MKKEDRQLPIPGGYPGYGGYHGYGGYPGYGYHHGTMAIKHTATDITVIETTNVHIRGGFSSYMLQFLKIQYDNKEL